jgi:FtsP/CotA-like multicopper oxidase with cupredoxin domain
VEYTNSSFHFVKLPSTEWTHLQLLGPLIRGVVGDSITVVFFNNATRNYTMHPHGLRSTKADPAYILPGQRYEYEWIVPATAGPALKDGSSVMWPYHSDVDSGRDVYSGLVGPIIIASQDSVSLSEALAESAVPWDVDREFVLMFSAIDESESHYRKSLWPLDQHHYFYSINGSVLQII